MTGRTRHDFHDKEGWIGQRSLPEDVSTVDSERAVVGTLGNCAHEHRIAQQDRTVISQPKLGHT